MGLIPGKLRSLLIGNQKQLNKINLNGTDFTISNDKNLSEHLSANHLALMSA